MPRTFRTKNGFTLVEMLVIIPVIILVIGGLVAAIVHTTRLALVMQTRTQLQLDVLEALNRIEQDVQVSMGIDTGSTSSLVVNNLATSKNPLDTNRQLIVESGCTAATSGLSVADALKYQASYVVTGTAGNRKYVRNVDLPACVGNPVVWQREGDEDIISKAESISVNVVYSSNGSLMPNTAKVQLTASRSTAGRIVSYTGTITAKSANIK